MPVRCSGEQQREFRAADLSLHLAYAQATLALCHARQGIELDRALADVAAAVAMADSLGAGYAAGVASVAQFEIAIRAGTPPPVDEIARRVEAALDPTLSARLARLAGVKAVADHDCRSAAACFERSVAIAQEGDARAELWFTLEAAAISGAPILHPDSGEVTRLIRDELGVVSSPTVTLLAPFGPRCAPEPAESP